MKTQILIAVGLSIGIVLSCQDKSPAPKVDETDTSNENDTCFVKTCVSKKRSQMYIYDSQTKERRLVGIEDKDSLGGVENHTFQFDNEGNITKIVVEDKTYDFEKKSSTHIRRTSKWNSSILSEEDIYLNAKGQVDSIVVWSGSEKLEVRMFEYEGDKVTRVFSIYDDDFDGNLDDTLEANINYGGLQVRNPTFGTGVQWENITNPVDNSAWLPYEVVWTSNGTVTNISRYQYVINKAGYPLEIKNAETGEVLKSYTYDCFSK